MNYYPSKVWKIAFHIVISGFLFCYTLGVFNTCADNVSASLDWGSNKSTYTTVFSAIVPVGVLIGAMVSGNMMNHYGRRKSIMITDLIMVFACAIVVIPTTPTFGFGRFVSGVAAGIFMTVPPSYISEITPDEMMPKIGPLIQISTNVGLIFAYSFGLPLPNDHESSSKTNDLWIFMFLFPAIVSLYQFGFFFFVCKYDSALWLMRSGNTEETMKSLSMIYTEEGASEGLQRFAPIQDEKQSLLEKEARPPTYKEIFTEKKYRKMLRIGILLGTIQQVSGINAGIFYSTSIFKTLGVGSFMSKVYTLVIGVVFFIASSCTIFLLKIFGRRTLLISGQILLAIDLLALGFLILFLDVPAGVLIVGVILIFVLFAYSLGGTLWMYCGEALIEKIMGISATVNSLWVCIVTGAFPITVDYLGIEYAFLFFGVCMTLGAVYCHFDLIETKDKSKAEIFNRMYFLG